MATFQEVIERARANERAMADVLGLDHDQTAQGSITWGHDIAGRPAARFKHLGRVPDHLTDRPHSVRGPEVNDLYVWQVVLTADAEAIRPPWVPFEESS